MSESPAAAGDKAAVMAGLEKLPDAALREVIDQAHKLLKARAAESRRDALREIQRLAKEHGLKVDVERKRGRPAKGANQSG